MEALMDQRPRIPYIPEEYGLTPDHSSNDKLIVDASRGDEELLLLILSQEKLGRLHVSGEAGSDYKERMKNFGERILARQEFLDSHP
jgi:hypothetical protein